MKTVAHTGKTFLFAKCIKNADPLVMCCAQMSRKKDHFKKDKYQVACLERCMDIYPLVYSIKQIPPMRGARLTKKQLSQVL